jgi:hypothetical protein
MVHASNRVFLVTMGSDRWDCYQCGRGNSILLTGRVGQALMRRAGDELQTAQDPALSIVFSATAFEAELAYLFQKWHRIDTRANEWRELADDQLETAWRQLGNVESRVNAVDNLLHTAGVDDFVASEPELAQRLAALGINVGTVAKDLVQNLAWPRNRIVHWQYDGFDDSDARRCIEIATAAIVLLGMMNDARPVPPVRSSPPPGWTGPGP